MKNIALATRVMFLFIYTKNTHQHSVIGWSTFVCKLLLSQKHIRTGLPYGAGVRDHQCLLLCVEHTIKMSCYQTVVDFPQDCVFFLKNPSG